MKVRIKIVTCSGQVFTTNVDECKLAPFYKERNIDFTKNLIMDVEKEDMEPVFIINGKYVESVTLTKLKDERSKS